MIVSASASNLRIVGTWSWNTAVTFGSCPAPPAWDPAGYESETSIVLNYAFAQRVGGAVAAEVARVPVRTMTIRPRGPYSCRLPAGYANGAEAFVDGDRGTCLANDPALRPHRLRNASYDVRQVFVPGRPARECPQTYGFDTFVEFTSSHHATIHDGTRSNAGGRADEVLLHEIVHGLRRMLGLSMMPSNGVVGEWDNADEFFAIMVTNYYSAERGTPIREYHVGNQVMSPMETSTFPGGIQRYRDLTVRFCREHPALASELERTPQDRFNPIRICRGSR